METDRRPEDLDKEGMSTERLERFRNFWEGSILLHQEGIVEAHHQIAQIDRILTTRREQPIQHPVPEMELGK